MTLNREALERAQAARDHLVDLQHQAEVARVDYHHAIRQLHAKGGSLREIADSLGLSHQRVHQIVEPVDGSDDRRGRHHGPGHHGPGHRGPGHHGRGRGPEHGPDRGGPWDDPRGPGHLQRVVRRLRQFVGFERFSGEARRVVAGAVESAEQLGHRRVGSEHLAIGVATATDTAAGRALTSVGVTAPAVSASIADALVGGADGPQRRPFTPAARRVLEGSLAVAMDRGDSDIRAHHILLALLDDEGDGAVAMTSQGPDAAAIRAAVEDALLEDAD